MFGQLSGLINKTTHESGQKQINNHVSKKDIDSCLSKQKALSMAN